MFSFIVVLPICLHGENSATDPIEIKNWCFIELNTFSFVFERVNGQPLTWEERRKVV